MSKPLVRIAVPLLILLAAVVLIVRFAKPAVPREIELLAGPKGSTFYAYARQYADLLGQKGITVSIVETAGSLENLRRLAAADRSASAFVLSGTERDIDADERSDSIVSLGSLAYEPFWLFVRRGSEITRITQLAGKRVSLGSPESDVRSLTKLLLQANGVEDEIVESPVSPSGADELAAALANGELDAVFLLGPPAAPVISGLLGSPSLEPVALERVTTYARLHPELAEIVLPEGAFDLAGNVPEADLHLIAAADNLVVRTDLHQALVDLLLDAAKTIHREPTLFTDRGTFPNMHHVSLPLSPVAIYFYENGPPRMRKYLPPWLASLISRFALIAAQVGAVAWILIKTPPALRRFRFWLKARGLYRKMEKLERRMNSGADPAELVAELREISDQSAAISPPLAVLPQYLELRQNIHDQWERIESFSQWGAEERKEL